MPRIFDNINLTLLPALQNTLNVASRADFCVGYFNLRGWRHLDSFVERWTGGEGSCCRLLVGMQKAPEDELRAAFSLTPDTGIDLQTVARLKRQLASEFRDQLTIGVPTAADEAGLRRLAAQIKANKVIVKLYLHHHLHAKLYLMYRQDADNPVIGYLGSSNLTFSGLKYQGELNVDVMDGDAANKLSQWFQERWENRWCVDISDELLQVIEESWARETPIPPYHIYLKMAYHLSQEARAGLAEFALPKEFRGKLFEYQTAAVKIAARHLDKRGGVIIGDVVGLGKTLMATALARMFEDYGMETLILCPKNLVPMWEHYRTEYGLRGRVLSMTRAIRDLPELKRYRLVLIDESHNLRNREGKVYRAIRDYVEGNESRCILLTATPYNKTYIDLSNQLRLFLPEHKDIGIRPEQFIRAQGAKGEMALLQLQIPPRSLAAFERSEYPDDWRELMRLYMVRRTRSFIQENYAETDAKTGRKYLLFPNGQRSYFPVRQPKTLTFSTDEQFDGLYSEEVVGIIESLHLPRYGLGQYVQENAQKPPTADEKKILADLSRARQRLKGFCKTNLFKRLESSGKAFRLSVERHILRNYIFLYAVENGLPLPIGTQDAELLDTAMTDADEEDLFDEDTGDAANTPEIASTGINGEAAFQKRAQEVYQQYKTQFKTRFKWVASEHFRASVESRAKPGRKKRLETLTDHLRTDAQALLPVWEKCLTWEAGKDTKLLRLRDLLARERPNDKVLIFTQFADTAEYLYKELKEMHITRIGCATGGSANATELAWRFSPESNNKRKSVLAADELRVLIATDVLSEGQNLQDAFIVVNYDLPWAIIRLIQRAGRVDRIGQQAEEILCCSFLPTDGVEEIIKLRGRLKDRLEDNADVVGTDEVFFEDAVPSSLLRDLYNEKAGLLDGDAEGDVDLASYAYQIWKNATGNNAALRKAVEEMPPVVYTTRAHAATATEPGGALVFVRTGDGNDALAWIDTQGKSVTESQYAILRAAECEPNTPAVPRQENHHELVAKGIEAILTEESNVGGQLGRPTGARFRTYERLKHFVSQNKTNLFAVGELPRAIDEIYRFPLTQTATDTLNTHLKAGVTDELLADLVLHLRNEDRLCIVTEEQTREPASCVL